MNLSSRPPLVAGLFLTGTVFLTGCTDPTVPNPTDTPNPTSTTSATPAPDATDAPDGELDFGELWYDPAEVAEQFTSLASAEGGDVTVTTVPDGITTPERKHLNFGQADPGPVPLAAAVNDETARWLVDVKGWTTTNTLPGAGPAPAGQVYAVAYMDVALAEGTGVLGSDLYFSLTTEEDGFFTVSAHPETYDGDYMAVDWEAPGVKRGVVAAVLIPEGSTIASFGLSIYGNGTMLIVDTDGELE